MKRRLINPPPKPVLCIEDPVKGIHVWKVAGVDTEQGELCDVRRCTNCHTEQYRPVGSKGAWR